MNAHREAGLAVRYASAPDGSPTAQAGRPQWRGTQPWVVALLLWIGLAAPAAAEPNALEQAAISQINLRRGQVGLPALTYNAYLEQSARAHAGYLTTNNTTGHFETSGLPGFTGVTPFDRIRATPYGTPAASKEVISFGASTGAAAVEGLIQAIYQRFGIFSSKVSEIGAGAITNHPTYGTVFVVNSAVRFAPPPSPSNWVGVYPYPGQTGVPRDFLSDTESPDPVTGANRVGYPISLHVDDDRVLSVTSFTVAPVGGAPLPAQVLRAATDPNGATPPSAAALIPLAPLAYNTEYEVTFTGAADITTPLTKTWRFTTAPLLPIAFSPAQPYLAYNSTLDIEISGGSGVYGASHSPSSLADVVFTGPRTLRVTSPASGQSPASGALTITVTDDEGHTGQVVITVQPTLDQTPNAFSFPAVTGAPLSTVVQSASITVSGVNVPTAIGIAGGEYSINGGQFTSQAGTVMNGNMVQVRLTSSASGTTTTSATLTIGGVSAVFNVTTLDTLTPSVPGGLAISNLAANSLTLSWTASNDNVGVTAYRVFRSGVFRATVAAPAVNFNDIGLTAATLYSYTVAACDAAGNCSAQSAAASATTLDNVPPSAPAGLSITNLAVNSLTLNWGASTDNIAVTAYQVFRGGVFRATVAAPTVSFNDSGLTSATSYGYAVAACDAAGNCSAQSAAASATTLDNVPPSVPAGLSITNLAANSLTLNWTASSDNVGVTSYKVYRGGSLVATLGDVTNYNDSGLTSATLYSYTVAACDAAGNCSAQSPAVAATTLDNVPPSVPTSLAATAVSASQINLAWSTSTDNVGVTAYQVFRGGVFHATVNAPAVSVSDTGLTNGTTYSYTVQACDAAGNCSAQSAAASATTPDTQVPSVPTGLMATAASQSQINLSWSAATDNVAVTAYQVFRGGVFRATVSAPTLSFSDTGLATSTTYSYTVQACDAAGNCSAQSAAASATTLAPGQYIFAPALGQGFNLIANSLEITLDVVALFGNQDAPVAGVTSNIVSVWKWNAVDGRWAFYSPQLTAAGIASFAAGRNYDVLSVINPGEGYWVNAVTQMTLPPQSGTGFNWNGFNFSALVSGFNLIAHADTVTPTQFNNLVSATPPSTGVIPTTNFVSLWAWDAVAGNWYFYSPLLESSGGLAAVKSYADSHGYLHFQDYSKTLGIGTGFWVNRP